MTQNAFFSFSIMYITRSIFSIPVNKFYCKYKKKKSHKNGELCSLTGGNKHFRDIQNLKPLIFRTIQPFFMKFGQNLIQLMPFLILLRLCVFFQTKYSKIHIDNNII